MPHSWGGHYVEFKIFKITFCFQSVMCNFYAKSKVAIFISNFFVHWKQILRKEQKTENNEQMQELNKSTRIPINLTF